MSHPLKNPVRVSSTNRLDVYRVEQRLRYLEYGKSAIDGSAEIEVDGKLNTNEAVALRQFQQIVSGKAEYNKKPIVTVDNNGQALAWLNAYNAPHWLQFNSAFAQVDQDPNAARLCGWDNKALANKAQGTSWLLDEMQAGYLALQGVRGKENLQFNGIGNLLGTKLNLGINPKYVHEKNQDKVDSTDRILGVVTPDDNGNYPGIPNAEAYKETRWDVANATALAGKLINPSSDPTYDNKGKNAQGANDQGKALLDFLSLYTATQKDDTPNNGSWEEIPIKSGKNASENEQIRKALFGDGKQATGLIDQQQVLVGGVGLGIGNQLTAEALKAMMGDVKGVNYAEWVEPLQKAMKEFDITTPQRITAFLAQVSHETSGLGSMKEEPGLYRVSVILEKFDKAFTYNGRKTEQSRLRNPNQPPANATLEQRREARYKNLQAFVHDDLGLTVLDNKELADVLGVSDHRDARTQSSRSLRDTHRGWR